MKKIKYTILLVLLSLFSLQLNSCRVEETIDPDLYIPNLGGTEYEETELDKWIDDTFRKTYNMRIIYRWDDAQMYASGLSSKLAPVEIDKVQPLLELVEAIWFEPYLYTAPYGFLQKYAPKTIVLIGSNYYDSGGNLVLGMAEGARTIVLTAVNTFNPKNANLVKGYMHTILHEFTHILHQKAGVPKEFKAITPAGYDPTGYRNHLHESNAWERGFLSRYSMYSVDEDFAEILSLILVNGLDWFEKTVIPVAQASKVSTTAAADLRAKIAAMEDFLRSGEFQIELLDDPATGKQGLVTMMQNAINAITL